MLFGLLPSDDARARTVRECKLPSRCPWVRRFREARAHRNAKRSFTQAQVAKKTTENTITPTTRLRHRYFMARFNSLRSLTASLAEEYARPDGESIPRSVGSARLRVCIGHVLQLRALVMRDRHWQYVPGKSFQARPKMPCFPPKYSA